MTKTSLFLTSLISHSHSALYQNKLQTYAKRLGGQVRLTGTVKNRDVFYEPTGTYSRCVPVSRTCPPSPQAWHSIGKLADYLLSLVCVRMSGLFAHLFLIRSDKG
ncbi:hypothetical protein MBHK15_110790 [Marinobacter salarius]|nr:hypothetical protein MBHK15_110790 [Marinobacter salarius]